METNRDQRPMRSSRKRTGGNRSKRIIRFAVKSIAMVCLVLLAAAVICKAARPYLINLAERREIAILNQKIEAAKAQRKALKEQIAYLATPGGREAEARKHGWAKPGEIAIVFGDTKDSPNGHDQSDQPELHEPFWHKAGRHLLGFFVREH